MCVLQPNSNLHLVNQHGYVVFLVVCLFFTVTGYLTLRGINSFLNFFINSFLDRIMVLWLCFPQKVLSFLELHTELFVDELVWHLEFKLYRIEGGTKWMAM